MALLIKTSEEDPTFRAYTNQETGETVIAGMGVRLIITLTMRREFKVEANVCSSYLTVKHSALLHKLKVNLFVNCRW